MINNGGNREDRQVDDNYSPQLEQDTPTDTQLSYVPNVDANKKRGLSYSSKRMNCCLWCGWAQVLILFKARSKKGSAFW